MIEYQKFTDLTLIIINTINLYQEVFDYINKTQNEEFYLKFFLNRINMKVLDAIYICTKETKMLDDYLKKTIYELLLDDLLKERKEIEDAQVMTEELNSKRIK